MNNVEKAINAVLQMCTYLRKLSFNRNINSNNRTNIQDLFIGPAYIKDGTSEHVAHA